MRIKFSRFILDLDQRLLLHSADEVRLSPKAFELLKLLVESRPKALSKGEIFKRLWAGTFVTDNTLTTLVTDLRTALGDDAHRPRFIRTAYGYGYAFIAEAEEQPAAAPKTMWRLIHKKGALALREGENIVGREGAGIVVLNHPTISRRHARFAVAGEQATIEDLKSKNGTWVRQTPVDGAVVLRDGDEVRLGSVVLVARFGAGGSSTQTAGI